MEETSSEIYEAPLLPAWDALSPPFSRNTIDTIVSKLFSVALLVASNVPEAMAAKCTATGELLGSWVNLTRFITITTGDRTFRYSMDEHGQTVMQTSEPSNLERVKGNGNLASPVVWNAHCAGTTWK